MSSKNKIGIQLEKNMRIFRGADTYLQNLYKSTTQKRKNYSLMTETLKYKEILQKEPSLYNIR